MEKALPPCTRSECGGDRTGCRYLVRQPVSPALFIIRCHAASLAATITHRAHESCAPDDINGATVDLRVGLRSRRDERVLEWAPFVQFIDVVFDAPRLAFKVVFDRRAELRMCEPVC